MNRITTAMLGVSLLFLNNCAHAPAIDPIMVLIGSNCPWYYTFPIFWKSCPSPTPWEKDLASKWQRPYDSIFDYQELYKKSAKDDAKRYRNDYINEMFAMIDEEQLHYQLSLRQTRAFADFFMDLGVLGLTAAGAVVGGEATKAILSVAASGLTGTKIAVSKAFYEESAISAILNQMDTSRNEKKLLIREKMISAIDDYPMSQAKAEMLEYLFSGSIIVAIKGLAEEAGARKRVTEVNLGNKERRGIDLPRLQTPTNRN